MTTALPADDVEPIQLLGPDGTLLADPRLGLNIATLDKLVADLPALYRDMAIVRQLDTEAIALQRQGELGLWPSLLGQEAAQVGAGRGARPADMIFPTYREHGVAWCRGVEPVNLLGLFRGTTLGGWNPYDNNFGLYTLVIGAQTLHAVGYSMGVVRDGAVGNNDPDRDSAVLVFLGDGALSEGETNEAFIWAATQNLPVVFFCQNNQWAISAPYETQSKVTVAQRASGFGFPGVRVDGNDVLACLAVTRNALDRAREGNGPTLIEAFTYRMNPHTTSDDTGRYRDPAQAQEWVAKDPLLRVRTYLESNNLVDTAFFDDLDSEIDRIAKELRVGCRALPEPGPAVPFDTTYAEMPIELQRQRAEHLAYVGSLQDEPAESGETR